MPKCHDVVAVARYARGLSRQMRAIFGAFGALAALSLAACGTEEVVVPPMADPMTERATVQGPVQGFVKENGTHAWLGIPFAATTAGDNRWKAPRPAPLRADTLAAVTHGAVCPQLVNSFSLGADGDIGTVMGDEDCLIADIYAPADAVGRDLPVMVWIHGGSNVWGSTHAYDGSQLAQNEDVIIVAVQYRLGPLGWFSHSGLAGDGDDPIDQTANFGTLDLVAALQWVKANIEEFGGDEDNVTIFGQSAGGHNVATLLATPNAKGLFHRAILQSGFFDSVSVDDARGLTGDQPNSTADVLARLGTEDPVALRGLSLEAFLGAYELDDGGFFELPRVIEDDVILPARPMVEAFGSLDQFNVVPIMTGTTRDEMKLFYAFDPDLVKTVLGRFIVPRDPGLYDAASDYSSRVWRVRSIDQPAQMMAAAGHEAVYGFRFDWDEGGKFLWMDTAVVLGAAHGMDIPFVFNIFSLFGDADPIVFRKQTAAEREALSLAMGRYWASFARSGVPIAQGAPNWLPYVSGGAAVMHFDSAQDGGIVLTRGADTLAQVAKDLAGDERIDSAGRCLIVEGIIAWVPQMDAPLRGEVDCPSEAG